MQCGRNTCKKRLGRLELVRITPVEIDRHHNDKYGQIRVLKRYWAPDSEGRFFLRCLTVVNFKQTLIEAKVKVSKVSMRESRDFIVYKYGDKPRIVLDLTDGQFYTSRSLAVNKNGRDYAQQQAHIIVEILKKFELSNAVIGKARFHRTVPTVSSDLDRATELTELEGGLVTWEDSR